MNSTRIERILDSGFRAVLVTTGGGSSALNALLTTPGASRFVADAHIPYSPEALERFLGKTPEQSVSSKTAVDLAQVAFKSQVSKFKFLSVSCTAALQTDRERRGADRAFICIKTEAAERIYALHFSKTSRTEQEVLLSDWLLILIAQTVGAERGLMFPGSFNPFHQGHRTLFNVAEERTGLRGVFELSCVNVDKPERSQEEVLRRVSVIKDIPVALTHAPRFVQKAELFPKTTFVLGTDTAVRLVDPAYSKGGKNEWEKFQALETKFLVAGRVFKTLEKEVGLAPRPIRRSLGEGGSAETRRSCFHGLEDLELPTGFEDLFEAIPESKFREDISSTELRGL